MSEPNEAIEQALEAMREPMTLADARRGRDILTHHSVQRHLSEGGTDAIGQRIAEIQQRVVSAFADGHDSEGELVNLDQALEAAQRFDSHVMADVTWLVATVTQLRADLAAARSLLREAQQDSERLAKSPDSAAQQVLTDFHDGPRRDEEARAARIGDAT